MRQSFSTEKLSEHLRAQYWNEVVCKHCVAANSQIESPKKFTGKFSAKSVGDLEISQMSASRHWWERTTLHQRQDPNEAFLLALMKSGTGHLSQSGRSTHVNNGDIVLYDAERPFSYELAPESVLLLRIPRKQLLYRAPLAERYTAVRFRDDKPVTGLLSNMISEMALINSTDDMDQTSRALLASSLLDLLGVAIQVQMAGDTTASHLRNRQLEQAKKFIESRLDDPLLTVSSIANAVRVSDRTLMRIFAESGITPMRWVWRRRLEAAYSALQEGRVRRVTEAAFRYGFSDMSHFSRMFKVAFGHSPKELLIQNRR